MALLSQNGPKKSVVTIDAISEETDTLMLRAEDTLSISVDGTYTGTVQLQRSFDNSVFVAVEDYAGTGATNNQKDMRAAVNCFYRLKATAWTSGSATAALYGS